MPAFAGNPGPITAVDSSPSSMLRLCGEWSGCQPSQLAGCGCGLAKPQSATKFVSNKEL